MKSTATNEDQKRIYNLLKRSDAQKKEYESKIIFEFFYKRVLELEIELEELREQLRLAKKDDDYGTE